MMVGDFASHLTPERSAVILADLVRTRSQNPVDGEGAVAEYVARFLRDLGLEVGTPEVLPGRPNVVGRLRGGGGPVLAFNSHLDTVPQGGGWTRDPFGAEIVDGQLYGRGSVDAKGSLAAFLAAIEAIVRAGTHLGGDLVMTAVMDEETCSTGARELVKAFKADFAVVGEPTRLQVGVAHRGSLRPIIVVSGRTAHSSRPAEGVNAVYHAVPVIEALREYAEGLRGEHPFCGSPSAAVTLVSAGIKENVIPDRCEITLDRRMVPGEFEDRALAEVEAVLDRVRSAHPEINVKVERCMPTTGSPSEIDPSHPFVKIVREAATRAGTPGDLYGMSGACDMTHFRSIGIPTVVIGPGSESQAHQPDEHMDLEDLHRGALAYGLIALAVCGIAS